MDCNHIRETSFIYKTPLRTISSEIRIILADDHAMIRQALRTILEKEKDMVIVGEAANGQAAVQLSSVLQPDIVMMDISMPILNGIEATRQIKAQNPMISILILTIHTDIDTVLEILKAGASGYLTKSVFDAEIIHTIRAVIDGEMVLAPSISQAVLKYAFQHITRPVTMETNEKLTPKELGILSLAAKGMSNKDIGARLNISDTTVKSYFADIFLKLRVRSRTEAVFVCLKAGWLKLDALD